MFLIRSIHGKTPGKVSLNLTYSYGFPIQFWHIAYVIAVKIMATKAAAPIVRFHQF